MGASFGRRYGSLVIFIIAAMCIIREAYLCATIGNVQKVRPPSSPFPSRLTPA